MKLTESPIATPLALGGVALLIKNFAPRLASGLAGQAVQEVFRPREEKRQAQELLLTHPDLTATAPPAGYAGSIMPYGGQNIRRLGTLSQEYPNDYGAGATGTQLKPSNAMLDIPRAMAAPPAIPAAISKYSPDEQAWRGLVGNIQAGPEGQALATKYGIEAGQRAQESAKSAALTQLLLGYHQQHPEMGLSLGAGKGGNLNVGLKTLTPQAGSNTLQPVTVGDQIKYRDKAGNLVEGLGGPRTTKTAASASNRLQSVRVGDQLKYRDKDGNIVSGLGGPLRQGLNPTEQIIFTSNLQSVNKQILETTGALAEMRKSFAPPERLAPLEKKLQDLTNEKAALEQTARETAGGATSQSQEKNPALQDFFKRNLPAAR